MIYYIEIPYRFSSLNEYLAAVGTHPKKGGAMKRADEDICIVYIRKFLRGVKITNPVIIHYKFTEPNTKRDRMNIFSYFDKCFEDSLQKAGVIKNDGWFYVLNTTHDFEVGKAAKIQVEIEELTEKEILQYLWTH